MNPGTPHRAGLARSLAIALVLVLLAACRREAAPEDATGTAAATPPAQAPASAAAPAEAGAEPSLADVIEHDPRYVVGISYPAGAAADPGLAQALHAYAERARGELMQAVSGLDAAPTAPYELSLGFRELMRSDDVVAMAADGSLYTGGAHGQPLLARFVWLPKQQRMLTAQDLIATPAGWKAVSDYVREQLRTAASTRAADGDLEPGDQQRLLDGALKMIDDGTAPDPANFAQFEPLPAAGGRIGALRFVFAPYQVGPYADGVQSVDVPAAVLRPYLAGDAATLFAE